jgi:hypothetical protein
MSTSLLSFCGGVTDVVRRGLIADGYYERPVFCSRFQLMVTFS